MKHTIMRLAAALLFIAAWAVARAQSEDASLPGTWSGTLNVGGQKLELIFNVSQSGGNTSVTLDIPAQGAKGIGVECNYLQADSVCLAIPNLGVQYQGRRTDENTIKGTFKQMGYPFALELKRGEVAAPNRPQTPQEPLPYAAEQVTFSNLDAQGVTLAGTLTYPVGYKKGSKVPVVLMVTGSGPQNRDEELFGHKPFLVLADYLARHGVASLRYDDRGTAESTGTFDGCTTTDFAADAKAGMDFLRGMKRFSRVGVVGHSEGGTIAFMLGAQHKADFVVALAAPAMKGDTLLASQTNSLMRQKGMPAQATAALVREQVKASGNAWMMSFIDYDPATDIKNTAVPVLAMNGSLDYQVPADGNLSLIKQLLTGKNADNKFVVFDGLNHLFQHAATGSGDEYYTIEETMAPEVMQTIAEWIAK